ncbi:MAG TPA: 23S rRNA (pseudouridine(1915)-N(3))-methyltransferase RlmH [Terriglobia bacterium]|nr:23S rRNA (pseudouridine(1915)-N(3))-methyltransferase RlmH [Terriglobia bacterium]
MRIRLIVDGKVKDAQLRALEADYRARIGHFTELVVEEFGRGSAGKGGRARQGRRAPSGDGSSHRASDSSSDLSSAERRLIEGLSGSIKVCLDAGGREWTSQEFAAWLGRQAVGGRRELAFLVGGPDGFSAAFKRQADLVLSLSRMTLTHEWARVLLLEQIYRGFAILGGHPYAK